MYDINHFSRTDNEADNEDDNDDDIDQNDVVTEKESNPLVVKMEAAKEKAKRQTELWFRKDIFSGLEQENDEDLEIEKMTKAYKQKGGIVLGK